MTPKVLSRQKEVKSEQTLTKLMEMESHGAKMEVLETFCPLGSKIHFLLQFCLYLFLKFIFLNVNHFKIIDLNLNSVICWMCHNIVSFLFGHKACGILAPWLGIKLPALKANSPFGPWFERHIILVVEAAVTYQALATVLSPSPCLTPFCWLHFTAVKTKVQKV